MTGDDPMSLWNGDCYRINNYSMSLVVRRLKYKKCPTLTEESFLPVLTINGPQFVLQNVQRQYSVTCI